MITNETSQSQAVPRDTTDVSSESVTLALLSVLLFFVGLLSYAMFLEWHGVQVASPSKIEKINDPCVIASVKNELSSSPSEFLKNGRLEELVYNCKKERSLQTAQFLRNNDIQSKALEKTMK